MSLLDEYGITEHKILSSGLVDVFSYVDLSNRDMEYIPIPFGNIFGPNNKYSQKGGFFMVHNNRLKSLLNCPQIVYGNFTCSNNCLESFEHSPVIVHGNFVATGNPGITSINGLPKQIYGDIYLDSHIEDFPCSIIEGSVYINKDRKDYFNSINYIMRSNKEMFTPYLGNREKVKELLKLFYHQV